MAFRAPSGRGKTPGQASQQARQAGGRFPGFDVLDQVEHWDELTAGAVLSRLDPGYDFRFFSPAEQVCAGALFDQLLGQHDEPKVPVLALVDKRLALGETDGWFYEDMPEDAQAWRVTLGGIDEDALLSHGHLFGELSLEYQAALVQAVQDAKIWHGFVAGHVWSLWTRYASTAFYSHPWAWNEIGFGGPAYPRGYKAIGVSALEPWEVRDHSGGDALT